MTVFPEFHNYDGLGLAELVLTKQVTPAELVEEAISRIELYNPKINAVIYKMYDQARTAAEGDLPDGPFKGVPFLLKDLFLTYAGVPTSNGNRLLKDIPMSHDSESVRRFKAAGLIVFGKTNTSEFGLVPYVEPEAFGPTRNPWNLNCTPGGSSGGSAAAVAARLVPMAHAEDTGGSIRIPASCCGIFGLKPSRGRVPTGPDQGEIWHGFVVDHVLTRSVRDSAAILDVIAGADIGAPYSAPPQVNSFLQEVNMEPGRLRVGFTPKPLMGHTVHNDCKKGLETTVRLLQQLGHEVIEATPKIEGEAFATAFLTIIAAETRAEIEQVGQFVKHRPALADFDLATYAVGMIGKALGATDYAKAARYLQTAGREISRFFEQYDVLLTPTLSQPPVPIGTLQPSARERILVRLIGSLKAHWLLNVLGVVKGVAAQTFDFMPYTPPFNVTGQPAMSVPLYWNDAGLPIGMHFAGRFGDEATLFRLAGQLERALPWFDRAPISFTA